LLQKKSHMALDPYASCPCGSGKKFKWCCQPIHVQIDRAFQQDQQGQHEVALRLMDEVIAEHPGNPEAWGRKAQLLYQNGQVEEAENALQKAFEITPKYAFGHLLRGMFRYQEGEIPGALLLFRKAADFYDPEARDLIAQVYGFIADCEMRLNRPVAARAALRIVLKNQPGEVETREQFEAIFGDKGRLPAAARKEYTFRSPTPSLAGDRRAAWDRALAGLENARLADVARVFEELSKADPNDAAAAYNLGLARAWLGDNPASLEVLDRYVTLETDEGKAGEAWALGEVLRCAYGMDEQSDYHEYSVVYQLRQAPPLQNLIQDWGRGRRLIPLNTGEQEGVFSALVLEASPMISATPGLTEGGPLAAYLLVAEGVVRLWGSVRDRFEKVRAELEQRAGQGLSQGQGRIGRPAFADVVTEAVIFPIGLSDQAEVQRRIDTTAQQFFEGTWLQRPLRSLGGIAPIDAAGHAVLRRKVRGVIQFLQDCAAHGALQTYDFDRVRRKLGLTTTAAPAPAGAAPTDITALGAPELAALSPDSLSDEQLRQALQTAQRLDAHEIGTRFARALVARPPDAAAPDRYSHFSYLIERALAGGNTDEALDTINEGEKADCEQNEGRRRNDYELRRGKVHARRGEADAAYDVFDRLIQRDPTNVKTRAAAAEAMLSLRQGKRALQFAEEGVTQARKQNDRDSEGHLMELAAAARKQGA
jgi:tetratricopeptide (TPR) repeat protein